MYIWDQYQDNVRLPHNLSDEEFLALYILQLKHLFRYEISAIKNLDLEYIAMSDAYIREFELANSLVVQDDLITVTNSILLSPEIFEQERAIIENQELQDSFFIFKKSNSKSLSNYVVRKRSIINPSTNNPLGIAIVMARCAAGFMRKEYIKQIFGLSRNRFKFDSYKLTDAEQQIAFCLYLGYHSRKEIAGILSSISDSTFNETRIKNIFKALYEKFECNTPGQIIQLLTKFEVDINIPPFIGEGSYPL